MDEFDRALKLREQALRILRLEGDLARCQNEVYRLERQVANLKQDNRKLRAKVKKKPR